MEEAQYKQPRHRFFGEGLERINAFSDGIFAIAITLLVLEIHVPDLTVPVLVNGKPVMESLSERLWNLTPQILIFVLSFLVIGIYWMLHHGIFSYIRRYDTGLLWLNNLFLLTVAFQPFPTAVLGDYGDTTAAVVFYASLQILSGLFKLSIWIYASYKHRLIDPTLDDRFIRYYTLQSVSTILIFILSFGLAYVNTDIARYSWFLLAVDGPFIRLLYPPEPRGKRGKNTPETEEIPTAFGPEVIKSASKVEKAIPAPVEQALPAPIEKVVLAQLEIPPIQDKEKK